MTEPTLTTATAGGVATLTLNRPERRNALSLALIDELLAALAAAAADGAVRAVVLSHAGTVFCSGVDLTETAAQGRTLPADRLGELLAALWECPKPVIARIGGPARAGGLGLIGAADIAVCAEGATFAFSEVRLGVVPAVISSTVLRRMTPRAAAELYLTGEVFDGRRAAEIGLVTAAVPADGLDAAVAGYCAALVRGGPKALIGAKDLLRRPLGADMRADAAALTAISTGYFRSDEGREGVAAFREKRDPWWIPGDVAVDGSL